MAARANIVPHARSVQAVAAHDEVSIDTNSSPDYTDDSSEKGSRAGKEEESAGYVKAYAHFCEPFFCLLALLLLRQCASASALCP